MVSNRFDVIVCGAGPAGCHAARLLAEDGIKVLLLEKETLPRHKPCGGGITRRALASLEVEEEKIVERWVVGSHCCYRDEKWIEARADGPVVAMVMREVFDAHLAHLASRSGARIIEGTRVRGVTESQSGVELFTDAGRFEADYLVAADGANSKVARCLGLTERTRLHPAISAELHPPGGVVDGKYSDMGLYDLGAVSGGYAWAFPKDSHYSVGICSPYGGRIDVRREFDRFVSNHAFLSICRQQRRRGWFLPVFHRPEQIVSLRTLLIGDAAGCVDPFTGEGISHAVTSASLAFRFLKQRLAEGAGPGLDSFRTLIGREIFRDLTIGKILGWIFYRFPRLSFRTVLADPRAIRHFTHLMAGETGYATILKLALTKWHKVFRKE